MTVWNGTWKPDGTGGWHTKSDKDIVDQYNSARLTSAPAQMLKDAIDEVVRLREENEKIRAVFRVNMLRAFPNLSHEEIDAEINRVLENGDEIQS